MVDLLRVIVALDVFALAAAIAMTFQAWRAHRVVQNRRTFVFFISFLLISFGLLSRMLTDVLVDIGPLFIRRIAGLGVIIGQQKLFLLISALLILYAYTLLLLVVERIRNPSMWILVFLLVVFTIFIARDLAFVTHLVAVVLLALLAHHFWRNYQRKNSGAALTVYLAFLALGVAHFAALLIPLGQVLHVVFLSLRLIGYFLLFAVSWRVTHR